VIANLLKRAIITGTKKEYHVLISLLGGDSRLKDAAIPRDKIIFDTLIESFSLVRVQHGTGCFNFFSVWGVVKST
jgi:hypothetical protein